MAWRNSFIALGLLSALLPLPKAIASDHQDGAAVLTDPTTDINDLYAWMSSDTSKVYLALTVFPAASMSSQFSNAAYYVFHTASRSGFISMQQTPLDIICSFDNSAQQNISCWVGSSEFVYGNANTPSGITSSDGKVTVFAGPRKDEFFFNLQGFKDLVSAVEGPPAVPITLDPNGCALYNATNNTGSAIGKTGGVSTATIRGLLNHTGSGTMPAVDHFASLDALAIVMSIPTSMLTTGGSLLSVWAATVKKM
jgi:phosphoribosylcarboxyaminoimidazole (NCAIR) mutase